MNRRGFFKTLATAAAGFAILPAATTYARTPWKRLAGSDIYVINPEWVNAPYEMYFLVEDSGLLSPRAVIAPSTLSIFDRSTAGWTEGKKIIAEYYPMRFINIDGEFVPVHLMKKA